MTTTAEQYIAYRHEQLPRFNNFIITNTLLCVSSWQSFCPTDCCIAPDSGRLYFACWYSYNDRRLARAVQKKYGVIYKYVPCNRLFTIWPSCKQPQHRLSPRSRGAPLNFVFIPTVLTAETHRCYAMKTAFVSSQYIRVTHGWLVRVAQR